MFPSAKTGRPHSRSILDRPFKDILSRAGTKKRFTVHGCRRTASKLSKDAAGRDISMAIAGHSQEATHSHYAPVAAAEKVEAGRRIFGVLTVLAGGNTEGDGAVLRRTVETQDSSEQPSTVSVRSS